MTHRVVFTREDGHWTVVAPEVHPAHTWGPNLKTASKRIKEAIALVLDLPPGAEKSMELDAEYRIAGIDDDKVSVFGDASEARRQLSAAQQRAEDALRVAVERGRDLDLSMRDIAAMTGVSHQRVAQVAASRS
jgi:hypothetical protein